MSDGIQIFLTLIVYGAIFIALLGVSFRESQDLQMQTDVARWGVEVEAEILGHFEAGALQGSELWKYRQTAMATWDSLELELRYLFDGREIVSRGRVSTELFFRTRGMKTLKIKVSPERPEQWTALA